MKPKITICSLGFILFFYTIWMLRFSLRQSKKHKIIKFRRNLLTMVETSVVGCSLLGYICFEQLNNFIIEYMYSSSYDVKYIFKYWFLFHVAEMILFLFLKNIWIIRSANLNFPEFNGLTGAKFPGQEAPRPILYGIFFIDRYTVLETLKF